MDVNSLIRNGVLKIIAKPDARNNEILGYDEEKGALKVAVAAPADKGKANKEIVNFFTKLLKKKVCIKSGLRSKSKTLKII